ncbi:CBN-CED-7 protein [Aphelenchoides avenae]|nr:CBN-CED-7 protein [Aphelenchus avenae]
MAGKGRPDTITSGIKDDRGDGQDQAKVFKNLMATLTILLCLSLAVSLMIFVPVAERSTKFMHQLFLTRVSSFLYWIVQLVGDFIQFLAVALLVFAFTWAFTDATGGCAAGMWPLWLLYFTAASMITYCASFIFASPTKAFTLMLCWQSIFPLITAVVILIVMLVVKLTATDPKKAETIGDIIYCVTGIVFPALPLFRGTYTFLDECSNSGMSWTLYSMDMDKAIGVWLVCLALTTVIFAVVLTLIQWRRFTLAIWKCTHRKDVTAWGPLENEDENVTKERDRLLEISDSDLSLSVRDLYKFFGRLCAVRKLTFGVGRDDCFGLLGINGAGKTTTFDILTGVTYQSSGSAAIEGVDVSDRPAIGYCPQVDALSPDLTGRETLTLIGRLNGLKGVASRVEMVLESIRLADEGDKLVEHYSGGQKRRISIGVALMSSSKLIMLDEPTAGVDPGTRRYVWDLLTALRRQNTALLLTSHSMEECEALCTRIAFMNRGSMISIGTSQHLKSKYGNTFVLSLTRETVSEETGAELNTAVVEAFHATPTNDPMLMPALTWELPRLPSDSWGEMYRRIEQFTSMQPNVKDFSLVQGTLEQVFIRLSKVEAAPTLTNGPPEAPPKDSTSTDVSHDN